MVRSAFTEHLLCAQAYLVLGPTVCWVQSVRRSQPFPRPTQQTLVLCPVQAQKEILSTGGDETTAHPLEWPNQTTKTGRPEFGRARGPGSPCTVGGSQGAAAALENSGRFLESETGYSPERNESCSHRSLATMLAVASLGPLSLGRGLGCRDTGATALRNQLGCRHRRPEGGPLLRAWPPGAAACPRRVLRHLTPSLLAPPHGFSFLRSLNTSTHPGTARRPHWTWAVAGARGRSLTHGPVIGALSCALLCARRIQGRP